MAVGFLVGGLRLRIGGSGIVFRLQSFCFKPQGLGYEVQAQGFGFMVFGLRFGFKVTGMGFRV